MKKTLKKIAPHLWYNKEARQAAEYYVTIFPGSKITHVATLENTPSGSMEIVHFELSEQSFCAISAGPLFKFNEAVSFMVYCDTQEEIDYYWEKLTEGGEEGPCGWLKDKFGLSWQIVPTEMDTMIQNGNKAQVASVTEAFLKMKKFDLAALRQAYQASSKHNRTI